MKRHGRIALAVVLLAATAAAAIAQGYEYEEPDPKNNVAYDGRFTFARIMYHYEARGFTQEGLPDTKWNHDYPRAEVNFTRILEELTTLRPYTGGSNIFTLDDPELAKYPVAYMAEPGFWTLTEPEAAGLRAYLLKGGFMIFDDFVGAAHWMNFAEKMRQVLPDARLVPLEASHPIFDAFYRIESLDFRSPYGFARPLFYGIYEDNDPTRRLLVIANFNNDISEYWEFSGTGLYPVELSNEAYKLGINYVIYGMTR